MRAAQTRFLTRCWPRELKLRAGPEAGAATSISIQVCEPGGQKMKQRLLMVVLMVAVAALCVPPVFAQAAGTVKGICKDASGNPIAGANLEWSNTDNGRKYNL